MLTIDEINQDRVVTMTACGKLTNEDYERVLPVLEEMFEAHGKTRFFIKLQDFAGFEAEAVWKDLRFDAGHMKDYGRIAVVGDRKWEEWGTRFSGLFWRAGKVLLQGRNG
ncbi:STAS/SEC14 domain-containing protein [bacterium]|nr:STAS/SEC14 domain-containing protein [bacterium]